MVKTCGGCVLPQLHPQKYCPIFNEPIDIHDQACKKYTEEIAQCYSCGDIILEGGVLYKNKGDDAYHVVCEKCSSQRGTCVTCVEADKCAFETDPSSLPKFVMKEIRQGNMIAQQQIPNPERIRQTCQNGCNCWNEEFKCLKQNGCCGNWKGRF